ncbi:MAG: proline--tRNA ligase [bacterium]
MNKNKLTTREENYSDWYLDVIKAADLAETSIVRGCMIIKPYGYSIWENIKDELDKEFKRTGHKNAYFPLFIPLSLLSREADHVKGFAKECAVVTHHRLIESKDGKIIVDPEAELEEPLIVRPTSETIMYESYSKWISSWRDLPIMINQWNNVVRWELRTRPFIRTAEFLWQEGHTAHSTFEEADKEARTMLGVYRDFVEKKLAIPVIAGNKSENEKFAGALTTYTIEAMLQDGKALQAGTSHNLGQNFAKAFDIKFTDKDSEIKYVWQTSWGMSTRVIGALIMSHSDDNGLVLPPNIAPIQVVVIPIWKDNNKDEIVTKANEILKMLKENNELRIEIDDNDYESPGFKFNKWEKKGVPIRIEMGSRDIENSSVTLVRRDTLEKIIVKISDLSSEISNLLVSIQDSLYNNAMKRLTTNTVEVKDYDEFKKTVGTKDDSGHSFVKAFWCEGKSCEEKIKEETKATTRCLPLDSKEMEGKCIHCGEIAKHKWIFAVSY